MLNKEIKAEYEDILLGKRSDFTTSQLTRLASPRFCADFLRYVFEDILGWGADDIPAYLTKDIVDKLQLARPLRKCPFPPQLDRDLDLWYVRTLLYPNDKKQSYHDINIALYENILAGKIARFPSSFFSGADGDYLFAIFLRYIVGRRLPAYSLLDLYALFQGTAGDTFLRDAQLGTPSRLLYPTHLDAFHWSLPEEQRSTFFYYYALFLETAQPIWKKFHKTKDPNSLVPKTLSMEPFGTEPRKKNLKAQVKKFYKTMKEVAHAGQNK